jgi:hypothetical protein
MRNAVIIALFLGMMLFALCPMRYAPLLFASCLKSRLAGRSSSATLLSPFALCPMRSALCAMRLALLIFRRSLSPVKEGGMMAPRNACPVEFRSADPCGGFHRAGIFHWGLFLFHWGAFQIRTAVSVKSVS